MYDPQIDFRPIGPAAELADTIMRPLMFVLAGNTSEEPQRTHRWNNKRLTEADVAHLKAPLMVQHTGNPRAGFNIFFHMPIFGGWKDFIVLKPTGYASPWHVGWKSSVVIGVSRVPLDRRVRMLLGPRPVSFFGIDRYGHQIAIEEVGRGRIGSAGDYADIPLL